MTVVEILDKRIEMFGEKLKNDALTPSDRTLMIGAMQELRNLKFILTTNEDITSLK